MDIKEDLISGIIEIEWEMFTNVHNRGGRASCQEDRDGFEIIRTSNFQTWSEATLASYLDDLKQAEKDGRSLMTAKYARMEGIIPPLNPEAYDLIDKIVKKECQWTEELLAKYPDLKMARPIYSTEDTAEVISSETYSRGELETYSLRTLELYYQDMLEMEAGGLNRIEMIVGHMTHNLAAPSRGQ